MMDIFSLLALVFLWTFWDWFRAQLTDVVYTLSRAIAKAIEDAKKR